MIDDAGVVCRYDLHQTNPSPRVMDGKERFGPVKKQLIVK